MAAIKLQQPGHIQHCRLTLLILYLRPPSNTRRGSWGQPWLQQTKNFGYQGSKLKPVDSRFSFCICSSSLAWASVAAISSSSCRLCFCSARFFSASYRRFSHSWNWTHRAQHVNTIATAHVLYSLIKQLQQCPTKLISIWFSFNFIFFTTESEIICKE